MAKKKSKKTQTKANVRSVDFTDVEDVSKPIPPGRYHARVFDTEWREPKDESKSEYINAELVITSEGEGHGRHFWDVLSLTKKALWKLQQAMEAMGYDVDGVADLDIEDWVGRDVDLIIKDGVYQGEPRSEISKWETSTLPSLEDEADDEEYDDDDEEYDDDEDDEEEEEEDEDEEEEDEDDDDDDEEDDEPWTKEELEELLEDDGISALKEVAEEFDLTFKKGTKSKTIITAILEAQEDEEDEDDDDDDDDDLFDDEEEEEEEPAPKKKGRGKKKK